MIGHNGGPSMERGAGFRKVAWRKARAELLPALPLEIVRIRVNRAKRLGLPYKTYATIRAVSGRDILAFLFSSNALDLRGRPDIPAREAARLHELNGVALRAGAIHRPVDPSGVLASGLLDHADTAPEWVAPWSETRRQLRGLIKNAGAPFDGTVVVAATELERQWAATGGFAGVLSADALFYAPSDAGSP